GAEAFARSEKRFGARKDAFARAGIIIRERLSDRSSEEGLMATETQTAPADTRHERQVLTGRVTSAQMEKTIVVEVLRLVQHRKYRRGVRISKKFCAHEEQRQANRGDTVGAVSSRSPSQVQPWRT